MELNSPLHTFFSPHVSFLAGVMHLLGVEDSLSWICKGEAKLKSLAWFPWEGGGGGRERESSAPASVEDCRNSLSVAASLSHFPVPVSGTQL